MSDDRSEMTTHEVLALARRLISDEERWCKESYGIAGTPMCAIGALLAVSDSRYVQAFPHAERALVAALGGDQSRHDPMCVEKFNDAEETTHTDVIGLFDKAIAATAPTPDMSWLREPSPVLHPGTANA
jgi:hypothetical protein